MAINRFGTSGDDTMHGSSADDVFFSGAGDDTMFGGQGNDTFMASAGSDFMFGEGGNDTVDYSQITSQASFNGHALGVLVSLRDGAGFEIGGVGSDHYSSIENVTGSSFTDFIEGDGNANVIRGLDGDDFIEGGGGADTLEGGNGNDTLMYTQSGSRVVVDLLANTASGGDATGDVFSSFENLVGSGFNDRLSGTNGRNDISGGDGNDTINARGGDDTIEGGRGNDVMTGGTGRDTFVFNIQQEQTGVDHITDFDVNRDSINIEFQHGYTPTITMETGNFNFATMTLDVVLHMNDSTGEAGTIILDDISLGDLSHVMGQVHTQDIG